MALTAHKTVTMFMRYAHTDDDPVRAAGELVASRRKTVVGSRPITPADVPAPVADGSEATAYRAFRHRKGQDRAVPPGSKRTASTATEAAVS